MNGWQKMTTDIKLYLPKRAGWIKEQFNGDELNDLLKFIKEIIPLMMFTDEAKGKWKHDPRAKLLERL